MPGLSTSSLAAPPASRAFRFHTSRRGAALLLAGLLVAGLAGCGGSGADETPAGSPGAAAKGKGMRGKGGAERRRAWMMQKGRADGDLPEPRIPVIVQTAARSDMEAFLEASSTLEAEQAVDVVSQATGVVVEVRAEEGDRVRRGQLLARLAYEELELAEQRARADLEKLRRDYERAENLKREELISEEEFQQVKFDYERARIDWQQRKLELDRTRILAPITGTVTERQVRQGQLVRENDVLYRIVDFDSLVAPVYVPEKYLPMLRTGQRALVRPRGLGDQVTPGRILRIAPVVDAQSGTVRVVVALDDRTGLRPGMFANVQLVLDTHDDVVVIPKKALVFDDERPYVFVVEDGKAVRRPVRLGYQDAERVEVVEGVAEGDPVVVVGQSALKDGSLVEVQADDGAPTRTASHADAPAARGSDADGPEAKPASP